MNRVRVVGVLALVAATAAAFAAGTRWPAAAAAQKPDAAPRWGEEFVGRDVRVFVKGEDLGQELPSRESRLWLLTHFDGKCEAVRDDWLVVTVEGNPTYFARPSIWAVQVSKDKK